MTSSETIAPPEPAQSAPIDLGPLPSWMKPAVDWVARRDATVHKKLLFGFLSLAVLLLGLGLFSIGVLNEVDDQVERINALHDQSDLAREMKYAVTAQSHFRAMALATGTDSWDDKIYTAKAGFASNRATVRSGSIPPREAFFDNLEAIDNRFHAESLTVSDLYLAGDVNRALALHTQIEHETSHDLEDELNAFIADADALSADQQAQFKSNRRLLTFAVAAFSIVSLGVALLLGAVISWSLIRPVQRMDRALELIADGDFQQHVEVPNRDEFGNLTTNLNKTSAQLGALYSDLQRLNTGLQETIDAKVKELNRTARLRKYVSPEVAEQILAGHAEADLSSSRKLLTIFLSDIRGFTEMTERMEPEHLVDELNEYLTEMLGIVFKHGGTLDKYIGDAILVFFGDPIPQDDQAQRALRMALEMQDRIEELAERWTATYGESFTVGMGISTGWVTVGNIGSPERTDYTVLGNEVNLASRLADRAASGEILITERTMMEGQGLVSGEVVDEVTLKGVARPIKIYSLDRPETLPEAPYGD